MTNNNLLMKFFNKLINRSKSYYYVGMAHPVHDSIMMGFSRSTLRPVLTGLAGDKWAMYHEGIKILDLSKESGQVVCLELSMGFGDGEI